MNRFIILTSIFPPTPAVRTLAGIEDWHLIVVGDTKTPSDWFLPGTTYLGVEQQLQLGYRLSRLLPYNHYCRKNIGYLYAISRGADLIADLDDDNFPYPSWPSHDVSDSPILSTLIAPPVPNVYRYFTSAHIWPRGLPLASILDPRPLIFAPPESRRIGVWQYLADNDPDVDAIYRLTVNKELTFDRPAPICLAKGVYSPFNSQNTIWRKLSFVFLFLPPDVSFRFTDILRSYIAQRCMWSFDSHLAFAPASVYQKRNPHDFIADFESEIPAYLHAHRIIDILNKVPDASSAEDQLLNCYESLCSSGIVSANGLSLCRSWLADLSALTL